ERNMKPAADKCPAHIFQLFIPPEIFGVIMFLKVIRGDVPEIGMTTQLGPLSGQVEGGLHLSLQVHLPKIGSRHAQVGLQVETEMLSLLFVQYPPDKKGVFAVFAPADVTADRVD